MTERTPSAVRFGVRRVIAALEGGGTAFFGLFDVQKPKRLGRDPKRCGAPSERTLGVRDVSPALDRPRQTGQIQSGADTPHSKGCSKRMSGFRITAF